MRAEPTCFAQYVRSGAIDVGLMKQRAVHPLPYSSNPNPDPHSDPAPKQVSFAKMLGVPVTHLTYEQLQRDSEGVVSGRG